MRARPTRRRVAIARRRGARGVRASSRAARPTSTSRSTCRRRPTRAFPEATAQQLQDAVDARDDRIGLIRRHRRCLGAVERQLVTGVGRRSRPPARAPVTDDMEFRVAQVTRAMTCDVLYALADEGTRAPRRPRVEVGRRSAGSAERDPRPAVRRHLGHRVVRAQLFGMFLKNPTREWNPRELASYGLGQPRSSEPGSRLPRLGCRIRPARRSPSSARPAQRGRACSRTTCSIRSTSPRRSCRRAPPPSRRRPAPS